MGECFVLCYFWYNVAVHMLVKCLKEECGEDPRSWTHMLTRQLEWPVLIIFNTNVSPHTRSIVYCNIGQLPCSCPTFMAIEYSAMWFASVICSHYTMQRGVIMQMLCNSSLTQEQTQKFRISWDRYLSLRLLCTELYLEFKNHTEEVVCFNP